MNCQNIRGFLRIVVLKALSEQPHSGYSLIKDVELKVGAKPSSGSIYPLLEDLHAKKYIKKKVKGRSNIYSITPSGLKLLGTIESKRDEAIRGFIKGMRMLSALTGENMQAFIDMFTNMRENKLPLPELQPELLHLRMSIWQCIKDKSYVRKAPKLKRIFRDTAKRIKSL